MLYIAVIMLHNFQVLQVKPPHVLSLVQKIHCKVCGYKLSNNNHSHILQISFLVRVLFSVFEPIQHYDIRIQVCTCASFRTVHYTLLPKVFSHPLNSGVLITSVATAVHNQAPENKERFYKHLWNNGLLLMNCSMVQWKDATCATNQIVKLTCY